ncbi:MAG: hypothetical protein CMJ25_15135 [Phycisphaerae bacterium]|nr:hypothetical protein [Phycisphaerae bacterium]|tara:strand:+ start:793 stop:1098 length:306 start_codon:yes stop_codon:yes gene_type:complete
MAVLSKDTGLVTAALTAQNTFTDWIYSTKEFNLSISGTFVGTITVQRAFDTADADNDARDVDTFTAPIETYGFEPSGVALYRAGFKTGEYTSGTANIRIGR